ncbi:MAG: PQQ-dependent sugar dehydrogenase [Sphingomicrobium sp.]
MRNGSAKPKLRRRGGTPPAPTPIAGEGNSLFAIALWAAWHLFALALLLGSAALSLPEPKAVSADKVQILLLLLGYLALSLYLVPAAARPRIEFFGHLVTVAVIGFAGAYLALRFAHLPASPWILGLGGGAAAVAALVPHLSGKERLAAGLVLLASAAALVASPRLKRARSSVERQSVDTALYGVNLAAYTGLVPRPEADAGAIESHGNAALLVTGDGKFYWVTDALGALHADPLSISAPIDRAAYLASLGKAARDWRLRITDLIFDRSPAPAALYVAHQAWNGKQRCFTQRVSAVALAWSADGRPRSTGPWRRVFESRPCVRPEGVYDDSETGGRLVWAPDGKLLFTLGSLGFGGGGGQAPFAQSSDADYGKILKLDPATGERTFVSIGHRNPQGLVVAHDGRIWESEHGPQGGDEINLIEQGANYGWPFATYGTDYGARTWSLNPDGHDHGIYHEPAFAFLPSVAISPIIELTGSEFPHWKGDLLAGSLRTEALFRIRTRDGRVIYVEPFSVGHRVRDLAELPSGRVIVWSDDGTLIAVSRNDVESAFTRFCVGCHEPKFGTAVGPPLAGVTGRRIASVPGWAYSAGLKRKSGVWDDASLNAFLSDPAAFAPGTTMRPPGLDAKSRAQVIAELKKK